MELSMSIGCRLLQILCCALVASCSDSGTPGPSPESGPISEERDPLYASSASVEIDGTRATSVSAYGVAITVPIGAATGGAVISIAKTADPATNLRFEQALVALMPTQSGNEGEYRIRLKGGLPSDSASIDMTLQLPDELAQSATAGHKIVLVALGRFEIEDDDRAESYDVADTLPTQFDSSTGTLATALPIKEFESRDGNREIIVRLMEIQGASRAHAAAQNQQGNSCLVSTETEAERATLANPLNSALLIVGPYGEPGHQSKWHTGIDFRAPERSPVYSARAGYIERIARADCKKGSQGPSPECEEKSRLFYVNIRHPDGTLARYLHLAADSVLDTTGAKASFAGEGESPGQTQALWVETNPCNPRLPVRRGQHFAYSGSTGTGSTPRPHLHFEFGKANFGTGKLSVTENSILRLGLAKYRNPVARVQASGVHPIDVLDHSLGMPILVRRLKPNLFLPIAEVSDKYPVYYSGGGGKPAHYDWPVLRLTHGLPPDKLGDTLRRQMVEFPESLRVDRSVFKTDGASLHLDLKEFPLISGSTLVRTTVEAVHSANIDPGGGMPIVEAVDSVSTQVVELRGISIAPLWARMTLPVRIDRDHYDGSLYCKQSLVIRPDGLASFADSCGPVHGSIKFAPPWNASAAMFYTWVSIDNGVLSPSCLYGGADGLTVVFWCQPYDGGSSHVIYGSPFFDQVEALFDVFGAVDGWAVNCFIGDSPSEAYNIAFESGVVALVDRLGRRLTVLDLAAVPRFVLTETYAPPGENVRGDTEYVVMDQLSSPVSGIARLSFVGATGLDMRIGAAQCSADNVKISDLLIEYPSNRN